LDGVLSYLTSRDKLERSQGGLEVRDVGLEFVKGGCDAGLQLGRMLPRRAVGSDLVEGWLRHDCDLASDLMPIANCLYFSRRLLGLRGGDLSLSL
jgi:hypothetical protein